MGTGQSGEGIRGREKIGGGVSGPVEKDQESARESDARPACRFRAHARTPIGGATLWIARDRGGQSRDATHLHAFFRRLPKRATRTYDVSPAAELSGREEVGRIRRRSSVAARKTAVKAVQKSEREGHLSLGRGRGRSSRRRRSNRPGISQAKGPRPRFDFWRETPRASAEGIAISGKRTEGRQQRGSIDPAERCAHVRYRCRL
jgi:hypothetical protein